MTYESWSSFAQTWGTVYFVAIFVTVLVYAFWPSKRAEFKRASSLPIAEKESADDRPIA